MGKRKKKTRRDNNKVLPGWMASYADMFTVLMVFFLLLFSMSVIDQELFDRFIQSFQNVQRDQAEAVIWDPGLLDAGGLGLLPEPTPPPIVLPGTIEGYEYDASNLGAPGDVIYNMANTFLTYMAVYAPADMHIEIRDPSDTPGHPDPLGPDEAQYGVVPPGLILDIGAGYIRISFPDSNVFFNSGQANLTPAAISALNSIGGALAEFMAEGHVIVVEGHTDDRPIQTAVFPSNWRLSGARATAVVEHLMGNFDMNPLAIFAVGFGEYRPIATNDTAEGRAANRRVEILIYATSAHVDDANGNG